jgi:hypothetical protein
MLAATTALVRVKRKEELLAALKQRNTPIIIENEELARPFERYALAQSWSMVAPIAAFLILRSLPEFKRNEWRVDVMPQHKVILTPWR